MSRFSKYNCTFGFQFLGNRTGFTFFIFPKLLQIFKMKSHICLVIKVWILEVIFLFSDQLNISGPFLSSLLGGFAVALLLHPPKSDDKNGQEMFN